LKALLDVNVLIALLDANHVHHDLALGWLQKNGHFGWSSCALTINGCIRIMSNSAYANPMPIAVVIARLREATEASGHESLNCSPSLLDNNLFVPYGLLTSAQVTDTYLLGLAVISGHRFVTFDSRISLRAVRDAKPEHLVVI
jgi:uncharacterized protein